MVGSHLGVSGGSHAPGGRMWVVGGAPAREADRPEVRQALSPALGETQAGDPVLSSAFSSVQREGKG